MTATSNAVYSFLSWTRRGLANSLAAAPAGGQRPTLSVSLDAASDAGATHTTTHTVELTGPGDIIGISPKAIIRQQPGDRVRDFLPNYLPFIEFYDEDFPWRHTPAVPSTLDQLPPWIALVVLEETEFTDAPLTGPLGAVTTTVAAENVFPEWSSLWAWAHVQVNDNLAGASGGPASAAEASVQLDGLVAQNPDIGCSRLMCPRRLQPRKNYHAFLMPAYETGRQAGLGQAFDPAIDAQAPAWGGGQQNFPYYYRWAFSTAERGDFEYLVSLLKPRPLDPQVGIRDVYVGYPGGIAHVPSLGVLGLEGALRSSQTTPTAWPTAYPEPFHCDLADFINAADGVQTANFTSDPIVTPPLYGRWHALHPRLSLATTTGTYPYDPRARWITELNLDPRHRTAAGLGAAVVQDEQEGLMNQAWLQVGDILAANRKIKTAQFGVQTSLAIYNKSLALADSETLFAMSQPLHAQIMGSEETIQYKTRQSPVPAALVSPTFRRLLRPLGKLAQTAFPASAKSPAGLLRRVNDGAISAAPPRVAPTAATLLGNLATAVNAGAAPVPAAALANRGVYWIAMVLAVIATVAPFITGLLPVTVAAVAVAAVALAGTLVALTALHRRAQTQSATRAALSDSGFSQRAVAAMPANANFRLTTVGDPVAHPPRGQDSVEAARFRSAMTDMAAELSLAQTAPMARVPLDLPHLHDSILTTLDPSQTIRQRAVSVLQLNPESQAQLALDLTPVMAYPKFERPMYEALRDLSTDYLIPNIGLIPNNTLSLLKENRRFIEAYMVGLNHEMSRELEWRGFPTDKRGSYFRQFWDVRDRLPPAGADPVAWKAQGLDIPEITSWPLNSRLGEHPNRPTPASDHVVLVLRGDLLNRFPNAVIYAHRATWRVNPQTHAETKVPPRLMAPATSDAEQAANQKYPLYSAQIGPDTTFLGFDLTIDEARGDTDSAGWFFVIKQRPGETHFGLDIADSAGARPQHWDDLTWEYLAAKQAVGPGGQILMPAAGAVAPVNSVVFASDQPVTLDSQSNAAAVAAILYQDPVLVAVHAHEMLPGA